MSPTQTLFYPHVRSASISSAPSTPPHPSRSSSRRAITHPSILSCLSHPAPLPDAPVAHALTLCLESSASMPTYTLSYTTARIVLYSLLPALARQQNLKSSSAVSQAVAYRRLCPSPRRRRFCHYIRTMLPPSLALKITPCPSNIYMYIRRLLTRSSYKPLDIPVFKLTPSSLTSSTFSPWHHYPRPHRFQLRTRLVSPYHTPIASPIIVFLPDHRPQTCPQLKPMRLNFKPSLKPTSSSHCLPRRPKPIHKLVIIVRTSRPTCAHLSVVVPSSSLCLLSRPNSPIHPCRPPPYLKFSHRPPSIFNSSSPQALALDLQLQSPNPCSCRHLRRGLHRLTCFHLLSCLNAAQSSVQTSRTPSHLCLHPHACHRSELT